MISCLSHHGRVYSFSSRIQAGLVTCLDQEDVMVLTYVTSKFGCDEDRFCSPPLRLARLLAQPCKGELRCLQAAPLVAIEVSETILGHLAPAGAQMPAAA